MLFTLPTSSFPARRCQSSTQTNTQSLASDSPVGLHHLQNPTCAQHYDDSRFSILAQGRSPFHLSALEATFIKTSNPALCRQKEFVYCTAWRLCTNDAFSLIYFQPITKRLLPINNRSYCCAVHSDDSSWQVSDKKLRSYEHDYHQPTLQIQVLVNKAPWIRYPHTSPKKTAALKIQSTIDTNPKKHQSYEVGRGSKFSLNWVRS